MGPMESHGVPWAPWVPWSPIGSHGVPWAPWTHEVPWAPWSPTKSDGSEFRSQRRWGRKPWRCTIGSIMFFTCRIISRSVTRGTVVGLYFASKNNRHDLRNSGIPPRPPSSTLTALFLRCRISVVSLEIILQVPIQIRANLELGGAGGPPVVPHTSQQ